LPIFQGGGFTYASRGAGYASIDGKPKIRAGRPDVAVWRQGRQEAGLHGKNANMELKYTIDDGFFVGYLDDYPEYTTLGEDLADFEKALLEIYSWIKDGTLEVKEHKGVLEVAE
jgi:hypothetical protein